MQYIQYATKMIRCICDHVDLVSLTKIFLFIRFGCEFDI